MHYFTDMFRQPVFCAVLALAVATSALAISPARAVSYVVQDESADAQTGTEKTDDSNQDTSTDQTAAVPETKPGEQAEQKAAVPETKPGEQADKTVAVPEDAAPADAKKMPEWYTKTDQWFGDYLVTPISTVFFFDFFTGPKPDAAGHPMVEGLNGFRDSIGVHENGWLGVSLPFVVIWLLIGAIYLTLRMGFINVRAFWHAIRLTKGDYDDPEDEGEVTHFQALSSALSATVGLGNIAGVAIAIGTGGPGACLWMILIGLFGMTSKFTECTLGQMYRRIDPKSGKVSGGPMRYLKDGLADMGMKTFGSCLAVFFAVLCIGASLGGGNAFQVGQSLDAIRGEPAFSFLDGNPWIYGVVMAILVGFVIIGGIKSIGKVASRIVPFMCAAYVAMSLWIIFTNLSAVGPAFQSIFDNAFNFQAGFGAVLGVMVIGIQRAVFSNEAGVGSAAIAHSAAKTDEPVSEGIVALLEPFIDTVVICTMTAIVVIIAGGGWEANAGADDLVAGNYGAWNNTEYGEHVSGTNKSGAALTVAAVSGEKGVFWFKYILYAAVMLFAYSTLISWYYYGERCWTALFGEWSSIVFKILFLTFTVLGSIVTTGKILDFSDLLILSMALPNMLGLFILSGRVRKELDDYCDRKKSGEIAPKK